MTFLRRVSEALRTPVDQLNPGQLRLLISQQVELDRLVPLGIALIADQPLLEGGFYPGDLFAAVCEVPIDYWLTHPAETAEVERLIRAVAPQLTERPTDEYLQTAIVTFRRATADRAATG